RCPAASLSASMSRNRRSRESRAQTWRRSLKPPPRISRRHGAPNKERTMHTTEHRPIPSLDATIERFLQALVEQGHPPLHALSPAEARAVLAGLQAGQSLRFEADNEDCTISGGPTGEIALRIVRPRGVPGPLPAVLYFHGGGWVLGDKETHDRLV